MNQKTYKLRFLPLFEYDLNEIVDYIAIHLKNPDAAERLVSDIEERQHPYYRIQVRNFMIFYVVIGDIMEVRRILYSRRNWKRKL